LVHLISQPRLLGLVGYYIEPSPSRHGNYFEVVDVVATAENSDTPSLIVEGRSSSPSSEYAAALLEALVVEGLSRVLPGLCALECGSP
jgi:hypothetical protein